MYDYSRPLSNAEVKGTDLHAMENLHIIFIPQKLNY